MPGVFGLISKMPRQWAEGRLAVMRRAMSTPSEEACTAVEETFGVYAGWTAHPGGANERHSVESSDGSALAVFSGEAVAEGELLETCVSAARLEDATFPAGVNGRFHGLVLDRRTGTTKIFVDRYGLQRLYYYENPQAFYFAAEAKALLALFPELRRFDEKGLGEFLACGCVLENRTLFSGIQTLPPGEIWTFRHGALESRRAYFSVREWEEQTELGEEEHYAQVRDVFSAILPRYFSGEDRIGMSLTGGLDSRMIMAWRRDTPGALPCYSFGGTFRDCHDVILARKVAAVCGQPHTVIQLGPRFLSEFSRYAERSIYLSDGCADVRHSADLFLNEAAAQIAPVRMTGNYGGEVLRLVLALRARPAEAQAFVPELQQYGEAAKRLLADLYVRNPLSFIAFHQVPWKHYGLLALEESQLRTRTPFLDNDLVRTAYRAPIGGAARRRLCGRLIAEGNPALAKIPTDRGSTADGLTGFAHRSAARVTVKAEYWYDYGMPQWLSRLDHALSALHCERAFLGRHKFSHFRVWYRDALASYVKEVLLDSRTLSRPYLRRAKVEATVQDHLRSGLNRTKELHQLLTVELMARAFCD